ncbi:sulfite exporter TauE/SafE family protein [Nonomuraea sp. MCN248]|uniref:Sulfite exporter TauE/SafE family protein n=1 Tax=Nonomuraea corallina TaxID=2989783 RepID=A0ABT4SAA5_9ACTN|nr:sulfite exporter TauE/SafE family protein [Nonomuraea corallina]MDA0633993.1 sulfite exporter TauE/SafE family protein [Nonomuraea corallina]
MQAAALFGSGVVAGVLAGTASCTAVQGGLLVGLTGERDRTVLGWFLTGRLLSYTAMGALLGLAGSAVKPPPQARAVLLVAAGLMVVAFAVRLYRRPGCEPSRRAFGALGPPLLGAATILVPCGVTIGMELIAISSGSPLSGAAVMAGFVLGTAPALGLLGWLLRRVTRTRLVQAAAVLAAATGLWTIGAGINLGGWLPATATTTAGDRSPVVTIWALRDGYRPAAVRAPAGVPVEVVFKRVDRGCTDTVVFAGRDLALPATVRLPPQPPGTLRYACGMGMFTGFITFSAE